MTSMHKQPLCTDSAWLGQEMATLIDHESMDEGEEEVEFNAANLPSGVYFYRFTAGGFASTHKMLMMR